MMNGSKAVLVASSIGSLVNGTKLTSLSTRTFISPGTTNACAVEMRRDVNRIFIAMGTRWLYGGGWQIFYVDDSSVFSRSFR